MIAEQINLTNWIERGRRYDLSISRESSIETNQNENLCRAAVQSKEVSTLLHDRDFYSWAKEQAKFLKNGQVDLLDYENLAEELDDMGTSQESTLESAIREALLHLLKLKYSSAENPRNGWLISVTKQRVQIESTIRKNPGLKSKIEPIFLDAWKDARKLAVFACRVYGELPNIPDDSPFSLDDVRNEDFFPIFDTSANVRRSIEKG